MYWLLILFFSFLGWSLVGLRFTRNYYEAPIWGLCAITVVIYLFSLINLLTPISLLVVGFGCAFFVFDGIYRGKVREKEIWVGMTLCGVLMGLAVIHSLGMKFNAWDEFSHWGLQLRYLAVLGEVQKDNEHLLFPDYIPGLSLFRQLAGIRATDEQLFYVLNWFFAYCCMLGSVSILAGPRLSFLRFSLCFITVFFGYTLFFQSLVETMYIDPVQSLLLLTIFTLIVNSRGEPPHFWRLAPLLMCLALTKHVGIVFVTFAIGLALVVNWSESKRLSRIEVRYYFCLLVACFSLVFLWKMYVRFYDLAPGVSLNLTSFSSDYAGVLLENVKGVLHNRFPHAMYTQANPYFARPHLFGSLWEVLLVSLGAVFTLYVFLTKDIRRIYGPVAIYLWVCLAAYILFLATVRGATTWSGDVWSFARYVSTLLFAIVFSSLILFFRESRAWAHTAVASAAVVWCSLSVAPSPASLFLVGARENSSLRSSLDTLAQKVKSVVPNNATVWYIYEDDGGAAGIKYFSNRYSLFPIKFLPPQVNGPFFSVRSLEGAPSRAGTKEAFRDVLKRVDYVITDSPSPLFWRRYGEFFSSQDSVVYEVVKHSEMDIKLVAK